jgi:hypothetical protein
MRWTAWVFAICTMTSGACSFDESGTPASGGVSPDAAASVTSTPDAGAPKPDACTGKDCDKGGGPGPD